MEDNEEKKEKIYVYMLIIGIIYIINCVLLFLINFTICLIHIRQPILRTNFFKVVFAQIILEGLIDFFLIILNLAILISHDNKNGYIILYTLLNFCIYTDIIYNIVIFIYLTFRNDEEKNESEDEEEDGNINARKSISFGKHSFKYIHICPFVLGVIHTIIFYLICDKDYKLSSSLNWYYFFYPVEYKTYLNSLIFFPYLIFVILSVSYLFISMNRLKVTNYIHLKKYSINCILGGVIGLIIPIAKVSSANIKNTDVILLFFSSAFFLLYLNCICFFRYNCYYVEHILSNNGKEFLNKIIFFIKLTFFQVEVPKPNFIDFNNPFIYHSLAYESDFLGNDKQNMSASFASQN